MARWEDDRDYERRSGSWLAPFLVLALIVLAGIVLLRPENLDRTQTGGQVGVGGGPPSMNELNTTVSPTTRVPSVTPSPSTTPTPTPLPGLDYVTPTF